MTRPAATNMGLTSPIGVTESSVAVRGARRNRTFLRRATLPYPPPPVVGHLGEMTTYNQALAEWQMEDDGCPNFPRQDAPATAALTEAAFEIVRSTVWRQFDLRQAAELAAHHVRAQELIGDENRARLFLAMVTGYRVRDQRR